MDRAKLEEAIRLVRNWGGGRSLGVAVLHFSAMDCVVGAAEAHLATLQPKTKMVEVQFWIATDNTTEEIVGAWKSEWAANRMGDGPNTTVHAFTKKIKVPA